MEPRIIRPTKTPYLVFSAIFGGVCLITLIPALARGSQVDIWPAILTSAIWAVLMVLISRRVITLDPGGISFSGRNIFWDCVARSQLDHQHNLLLIYDSASPLSVMKIPLNLYSRSDIEYLLGVQKLKFA